MVAVPATLTNDEPPALRIAPDTGEAEEDVSDELTVTGHWKQVSIFEINDRRCLCIVDGFLLGNGRKYYSLSYFGMIRIREEINMFLRY